MLKYGGGGSRKVGAKTSSNRAAAFCAAHSMEAFTQLVKPAVSPGHC